LAHRVTSLLRNNSVALGANRTSTSAGCHGRARLLRIKHTLDGAEIDKIIANVQGRNAMAIEHRRQELAQTRAGSERFSGSMGSLHCRSPATVAPDRVKS
jgi:hypothetical protein